MRAQHRRFCDRRVIFSSIFGWVQAPGLEAGELVDRSYSGRPRSRPWHLARCRPGDVSAPDLGRPASTLSGAAIASDVLASTSNEQAVVGYEGAFTLGTPSR